MSAEKGDQGGQQSPNPGKSLGNAAGKGAQAAKTGMKVAKAVKNVATIKAQLIKYAVKIGVPVVLMLIIGLIMGFVAIVGAILGSTPPAGASCLDGGPSSLVALATNGPVNVGSTYTYPSSPPSTGTITTEMMANAQGIVRAGFGRNPKASDNAIIIALATALTESQLINSDVSTDLDSKGLFQQRASAGWGTPADEVDVTKATNMFLDALYRISGWESMDPGAAAQKVQGSAFPDRYSKLMGTAAGLFQSIQPVIQGTGSTVQDAGTAATGAGGGGNAGASTSALSSAYLLGDSITVSAKDQYSPMFAKISAVSGRSWLTPGDPATGSVGTTGTGKDAVNTDQAAVKSAGAIVIALGTNGGLASNPPDDMVAAVRAINTNATIYWVNIAGTATTVSPNVVAFNNKLNELQSAGKITVINWANEVDAGGDGTHDPAGLLSDGIHPNAAGITKLVGLVSSSVKPSTGCSDYSGANGGDPKDCPAETAIPAGTNRAGVNAHDLCVDSVKQARSPQAGKAIIWAFHHLGIPYGRPDGVCATNTTRTGPDYYDCSGFATSAYTQTGTDMGGNPTTSGMWGGGWAQGYQVTEANARPGDLLFPSQGHVVMVLANNMIVHTNHCGDVSHIRTKYSDDFMEYFAVRAPATAQPA